MRRKKWGKISFWKYIYYNYFCKNIIRLDNSKIIPYQGAVLDLAKGARLVLSGRDLEIGFNRLRGSSSETQIRLEKDAVWECENGGWLFYNTILEVKSGARLKTGFFSMNGGCVIIADQKIEIGEDVMMGRNIIVYDSDFHQIQDEHGVPVNPASPVYIEDHVWLTSNITVLKGVRIGKNSVIAPQTVIRKDVPSDSFVAGESSGKNMSRRINWSRARCER